MKLLTNQNSSLCHTLVAVLAFVVATLTVPISSAHAADTQLMYRLYNPNSGEHFYTADVNERDATIAVGWSYEGEGWTAPVSSNTPVYRLYSGTDHHYTTSAVERDSLVDSGWLDEGIGWYSDDSRRIPLYRQFNPNVDPSAPTNNSGSHNYTISLQEHNLLVKEYLWHDEAIAWYGVDVKRLGYVGNAEIDTAIAINPTLIGGTSEQNHSQWATLTGIVRCEYVNHPGLPGQSRYMYYLQLPQWIDVQGSQYEGLGGYAVVLADYESEASDELRACVDRWTSIRCRLVGRVSMGTAGWMISPLRPSAVEPMQIIRCWG